LDGTAAYLTPIPGSTSVATTSYKIEILLDAPLLRALATGGITKEKADPKNYLESPGVHAGWQEAASVSANQPDSAKQYFPFPIQGLLAELLDPQGQPIGIILLPKTFSGRTIELTVIVPRSFETELSSNPGLSGYSLTFEVSYIGATKETAKSSVVLSEEIIRNIAADLTSNQQLAGDISLSSEDDAKSRIKQTIIRAIKADGSSALRLLQDIIADQLTGKIYEFLMKRDERIQVATLDTIKNWQDILNYLQKTFSKPIVDKVRDRKAEMSLYHYSKDNQWEKLDHSHIEAGVSVSAGLALGPVSAKSESSFSGEMTKEERSAWQEALKTQYGIETEVDSLSGFLKITSLSSQLLTKDKQELLVEDISKIELRTSIEEGRLPPITVMFPSAEQYRQAIIQLFPVATENEIAAAQLIQLATSHGRNTPSLAADGLEENVLSSPNTNAPYDGILQPQNLFSLLTNADPNFKAVANSSTFALKEYPGLFWHTRISLSHPNSGQAIEVRISHCGSSFSAELPPDELVDPRRSLLTGLRALGFSEIVENLKQLELTSDQEVIAFITHSIQAHYQSYDINRRQKIKAVIEHVRRQADELHAVSTWISYRTSKNTSKATR
jgi:hypothetical protein